MNALGYAILRGMPHGDREASEAVALLAATALAGRQLLKVVKQFDAERGNLISIGNASVSLMNREREQAHLLAKAVYDIRLRTKGFQHEETLLAAHKYCASLAALRQYREARALSEKVFRQREKMHGFAHVLTLRSAGAFAQILFASGDRKKALALQERVCRASLEINGREHEQTRIALNNLGEMQKGMTRSP
jgi:hypothetical protein